MQQCNWSFFSRQIKKPFLFFSNNLVDEDNDNAPKIQIDIWWRFNLALQIVVHASLGPVILHFPLPHTKEKEIGQNLTQMMSQLDVEEEGSGEQMRPKF